MRYVTTLLLCCLLAPCFTVSSMEHQRLVLENGAEVIAPILYDDAQRVLIDLGFEVLSLPKGQVRHRASQQEVASAVAQRDLYQVGRLSSAPVGELVERHGDSVIMVSTPVGLGSGFFISGKGHVITNYHVIERQTHVRITRFQRQEGGYRKQEFSEVKILAIHPLRDIALLQVQDEDFEPDGVQPLTLAEPNSVRSGDGIFAIGNPLGLERIVTQGIVSSTIRTLGASGGSSRLMLRSIRAIAAGRCSTYGARWWVSPQPGQHSLMAGHLAFRSVI